LSTPFCRGVKNVKDVKSARIDGDIVSQEGDRSVGFLFLGIAWDKNPLFFTPGWRLFVY
jgi:hypothetical protein